MALVSLAYFIFRFREASPFLPRCSGGRQFNILSMDARNAIAHADYTLVRDGMRLRRRNGGQVRAVPWKEFDPLISRGLNLFSFIRQIIEEHVRSYHPPKAIKSRMNFNEPPQDYTIYYDPSTGSFDLTSGKDPPSGYNNPRRMRKPEGVISPIIAQTTKRIMESDMILATS
jgi:hypothetical protein